MIQTKCIKAILKVLEKYIDKDKMEMLLTDLINVPGTNSSFKYVFKYLLAYINKE